MKSYALLLAALALLIVPTTRAEPLRSAEESLSRIVEVLNRPVRTAEQNRAKLATALQMIDNFRARYDEPGALGKAAFLAGQSHLSLGNIDQALSELDHALELPMDDIQRPAVEFIRGVALQQLGRTDEAVTALKAVRHNYPESQIMPELRLTLASFLADAGHPGQAVAILDSLTAPDQPGWVRQRAGAMLPSLRLIGEPARPFQAWDSEGREITLAQYRGKVVLIDFWASWCAPCRAAMPDVISLYDRFHDQGFDIIGVSLDNSRSAMQSYVSGNGMEWRQVCECNGWESTLAQLYEVRGIPKTFLVDQDGNIAGVDLKGDKLEAAVERLLR